jgi:hypothetical protein
MTIEVGGGYMVEVGVVRGAHAGGCGGASAVGAAVLLCEPVADAT